MYTVKILSEASFRKLPFSRIQENPDDVLGASDPKAGIAYIKDTGYNDVTKNVIAHELDELMATSSPHEDGDGIRYFSFGDIFKFFGGAAKSIAKPIARGVGAIAKAPFQLGSSIIKGLTNPGGVFSKFSGGRGDSPVSIPTPSGAGTATFPGFGQGPIPRASTGSIPGFSGPNPAPSFGGGTTSAGGGLGNIFRNLFAPQQGGGGEEGGDGGGALDLFRNIALPVGISSLGNLFAPKAEAPDFSGITSGLRDTVTGANASPLRQLGELRLTENLNTDITEPPDALFTQGDRVSEERLTKDLKNLEQAFKAANPRVNVENNSAFLEARNEIVERERQLRGEERDRVSSAFVNQQKTQRAQDIQTALNLDQAQTQQLIQLAQLDVAQIVAQTNISFAEAQQVKQLFGDLGSLVAQNSVRRV